MKNFKKTMSLELCLSTAILTILFVMMDAAFTNMMGIVKIEIPTLLSRTNFIFFVVAGFCYSNYLMFMYYKSGVNTHHSYFFMMGDSLGKRMIYNTLFTVTLFPLTFMSLFPFFIYKLNGVYGVVFLVASFVANHFFLVYAKNSIDSKKTIMHEPSIMKLNHSILKLMGARLNLEEEILKIEIDYQKKYEDVDWFNSLHEVGQTVEREVYPAMPEKLQRLKCLRNKIKRIEAAISNWQH